MQFPHELLFRKYDTVSNFARIQLRRVPILLEVHILFFMYKLIEIMKFMIFLRQIKSR